MERFGVPVCLFAAQRLCRNCYSYQHLSRPSAPPPCRPITPLSLSSQTVCHLIQLFFKADTLGGSPQNSAADAPRVTSAAVCKVGAFKRHRCKRHAWVKVWESANAHTESSVRGLKRWRLPAQWRGSGLCCLPLIHRTLEVTRSLPACVPAPCLSAAFAGTPPDTEGPG